MKAIITGATGGVGRNLGEYLVAKGWEVLGFGRDTKIGEKLGYRFKSFDISSKKGCLDSFEKADIIYHCAALSSPWGDYSDFYNTNVIGTKNILEAMKLYDIPKIIHISTPSIYFDFSDQRDLKEDFCNKKLVNSYAKTKYLAEQEVLKSKLESVIIRPRGIFGEYDSVLIPRLLKIANRGFLPLIKDKNPLVDVTYVGNVVYALYLCATKELPNNSIFNITNDEPMRIKELFGLIMKTLEKEVKYKTISYPILMSFAKVLELFSKLTSKEPLITCYGVGLISSDQTLDINRAKNILGYRPIYTVKEGLDRYAKSRS